MITENTDITETDNGAIPARPLKPSELLIMRHQALTTKHEWEAMAGMGTTYNIPRDDEVIDDADRFCDQVVEWCVAELRKADERKRWKK